MLVKIDKIPYYLIKCKEFIMSSATITSKGQTTIPKDIREALDLQPKDKVEFTLLPDGTVIMRAKRRSILELHGLLHSPERKTIPLENMSPWS